MKIFNSIIANTLPYVPKSIVGIVSKKYIAGENVSDAIAEVKGLNAQNSMCTVDLLGEFVASEKEVKENISIYKDIIIKINEQKLASSISIKPTSFGALINRENCYNNIEKLVSFASNQKVSVTVDMEDHPYTDFTLESYNKLRQKYPNNIRTVVQAYLKRTFQDVRKLTEGGKCSLRLCKGIYNESSELAYKNKEEINKNYLEILEFLFSTGSYVGIATHDDYLVYKAFELIKKYSLTSENYEFQMLLGVRSELRKEILKKQHPLRIYIPFGKKWYEYSLRRLKENPNIVGNILKGVFTFGR